MSFQKVSGHKIFKLFSNIPEKNRKEFNKYEELIISIDLLDGDGCKFRYSKDNKGNKYNNSPQFINTELVARDTIEFCKKIINL